MGVPTLRWEVRTGSAELFFGKRPAQWIYGTTIDLQRLIIPELPFPNPIPIKFRLFSAYEDDLVIEWTPDKKISNVKRPELNVPDSAKRLLDPVYFIVSLARLFAPIKAN
jgi:hypothetical protein